MKVQDAVKNGLIVSCQALEGEPLHGPMLMASLAWAAKEGGAAGLRVNSPYDVEVCKRITGLPTIGLHKETNERNELCITPTFQRAKDLVNAGADIIAVDVRYERPFGEELEELISRIKNELKVLVMADCGTLADAVRAEKFGADLLSTTFGFQPNALGIEPNFQLLQEMLKLDTPVVAEGGFWYPEQVSKAIELGSLAVVVGTAITRPKDITSRFVQAITLKTREKAV